MTIIKNLVLLLSLLAILCSHADEWYKINTLTSDFSTVMIGEDINNDNNIVGYASIQEADGKSFRQLAISTDGEISLIESDISSKTIAFDSLKLNDTGQVIGNYRNSFASSSTPNASFVYLDGELHDLGSLSIIENSQKETQSNSKKQYTNAYDLNNKGEIIGISTRADGTAATFLWARGKMVDFSTLHPSFINRFYAFPEAINDNSEILIRNNRSKYAIYKDGELKELDIPIHCDNNIINIKTFTNNGLIAADCRNFKDGLSFEAIVYDVNTGIYTNVAQSLNLPERSVQILDLNESGIGLLRYSYKGERSHIVYNYHDNSYLFITAYLDPDAEEMLVASLTHLDSINDSGEILAGKYLFSAVNNLPPYFNEMKSQTVIKGETLSYLIPGAEYDMEYGNLFTYTSNQLPTGAYLDPTTGEFSWTPSVYQDGTYFINITLTDNALPAESRTEILEVTVKNPNSPPMLKSLLAQELYHQNNVNNIYEVNVASGEFVSLDIEFSDSDGDELLIAVDGAPNKAQLIDIYNNLIQLRWQTTDNDVGNYELKFQSQERANPFISSPVITVFVNVE